MRSIDAPLSAIESLGIEHFLDAYDDCLRNGMAEARALNLMLTVCGSLLAEAYGGDRAAQMLRAAGRRLAEGGPQA